MATRAAQTYNPLFDAKIAKAAAFAQPVLQHIRDLVHKAVPEVTEEIKWGMCFYLLDGKPFCSMASFKAHCSFGFWKNEVSKEIRLAGYESDTASGMLGRITCLQDLPKDKDSSRT